MSTADLVADLDRLGVGLWLDGDQLRFRAPQGVMTAELKARLTQHKGDLLEFLREVQTSARLPTPAAITPAPREGALPLSFAQERLWFVGQWEPESAAYNIFDAVLIEGRLDAAALENSLGEVVRRHEVLRTTYAAEGGRPSQSISPAAGFELPAVDLSGLGAQERESEMLRLMREETERPFDLARGPLLRATLFRLEEERHALLFNMHHIVSDGWSAGVLVGELMTLYAAFTSGRRPPLAELPIQYADFAVWQREWLSGERLEAERAFWLDRLKGAPASLDLPTDYPRPAARTSLGATHHFALPPALCADVRSFCRRHQVTPFMLLLAAWNVLLWKYSGQADIVVGSPHANRNRTELEGLIGFFVNTLVLRTDLSGDPTFAELLGRVRDVTVAAQAHQDLPFEKIVDDLQPARDPSRTPVFQVAFVFQNAPTAEMRAQGLRLSRLRLPTTTSKFDLTLTLTDAEPSMPVEIEYSADLFAPDTIARLAAHFETLLADAVARPERRISALRVLTEEERHRLVAEWNATASAYPRRACVHELFERQAEESSEAVALTYGDREITYGELNVRANRLARYLAARGVGPESRVGVCLERGAEMIVALLGILKAGGAYVPLDAEYPRERLAFMLEESGAGLLLTQRSLAGALPAAGAELVCLEDASGEIATHAHANLPRVAGPENVAYVMFTSGSTGRPKGIAVTHRNIVRLVRQTDYARFGPDEVFLQFAPASFDASTFEIWGSLLNGARLVVFPHGRASLEELGRVVREGGVTTLWLTAGLFHQMVEGRLEDLRPLRQLLAGGDVLSPGHVRRALEGLPGCRVINGYGPTESTTFACCHPMEDASRVPGHGVPIGRPISNTRVYVLDSGLRPAPVGVPGELFIAGDGLARGYLNRPGLTAEKFVPDPFGAEPGARMYRTGDLVKLLPDSRIEFLGRIDNQVKVRGFRIELGEVEAALAGHPEVEQSVVIARGGEAGDKRLVAYLVATDGAEPTAADLREYLKRRLPDYMIPSAFVRLEGFPLTVNGKVDRRALPEPEAVSGGESYVAPRTPTEEMLAGIWADLLQAGRVGVHDSFFDLGGHSLLATQVVARVGDNFGVSLPLKALFEAPTVAGLAERVEQALVSGQEVAPPPIVPVPRGEPLPLSFAQENLWLFEQLVPGTATYNTCRAGRVRGPLDVAAVEAAFNELLERHEVLRTSYATIEGRPVQVVHPHRHYAVPLVDLSALAEDEREAAAFNLSNQDAQLAVDITAAPVARAKLLRLGPDDHVFVLSIHHIAYDLWSGGVLLEEMERAYLAYASGRRPELPPLPVQCADFAVWQREWLRGETLERQFAYWKERLAGLAAEPLALPTDRPRAASGETPGASVYPSFPPSANEAVKELARRENVTQFMALLAVFKVLLHRYTGQDDLAVGSAVANRNRVEMEGVVGFFDNTMVLRTDASGDPTFREFLGRVREAALGAYANQHLPFDLLVKELQPERASNRTPFVQAMFIYLLNYPAMEREIAGLRVVPYKLHSGRARFDITFGLRESPRGLEGELAYNSDLFDEETAERMCRHFGRLLEAATADPDRRLSELEVLAEEERRQLLFGWNETAAPGPAGRGAHELFEEQAERTPQAVALAGDGVGVTYARLNERANQLAHHLRARGVGAESRVGLCLGRTAEVVVGLLGILKAGGAYVPLDPSYPRERLAHVIEDAGVSVVLTDGQSASALPEALAETINLDAERELIGRRETANPVRVAGPDSLAYVIYTSGSTGRPKGVMIEHAAVVNLAAALRSAVYSRYEGALRVGLNAPLAFDASVKQWLQLLDGHALYVVPEEVRADPHALLSYARRHKLNVLDCTPSQLKFLLDAGLGEGDWPSPVVVLVGGEMIEEATWARLAACETVDFYNVYGPTECTVDATVQRIRSAPSRPVIGRPVDNARAYVLDGRMNPAPVGVPGELYVGGAGVARGYLDRPGLTAEKFVPDPFGAEPGARLYRTGDRVRWTDEGRLEILGRVDQQVKVRGFRIELGEIEAALAGHPAVREGVVAARGEGEDRRLVAYVVGRPGAELSEAELREYLGASLPRYMVPSVFVELDALPKTPTGKVDRRALPAPSGSRLGRTGARLGPRDEVELRLSRIWEGVLGAEELSVDDSFFDLGGHSLLAVQLMSRIAGEFGRVVPLGTLLEDPTIEGLARALRRAGGDVAAMPQTPLVAIRAGGTRPPFYCVHPVGGNALCYVGLARHLGEEQPFYAFQQTGAGEGGGPLTIEAMAARYVESLRAERPAGPYRLGGWSMGGLVAFEMARQLEAQGERVELLALIDSFAPPPSNAPQPPDEEALAAVLVRDLEGITGGRLDLSAEECSRGTRDDALGLLLARARAAGVVHADFGMSELRHLFDLYRNNVAAARAYRPGVYAGRVALFRSTASASEAREDTSLGWGPYAQGGVEVYDVEGDHYSIVTGEPVRLLAGRLGAALAGEGLSVVAR